MKKKFGLSLILAICLASSLGASLVQAKPAAYVPANFSVSVDIAEVIPANRKGLCVTGIGIPDDPYRAGVGCEMQTTTGGVTISSGSKTGSYGGPGVGVTIPNTIGYTGAITVFSSHNMWVGATVYVHYLMVTDS